LNGRYPYAPPPLSPLPPCVGFAFFTYPQIFRFPPSPASPFFFFFFGRYPRPIFSTQIRVRPFSISFSLVTPTCPTDSIPSPFTGHPLDQYPPTLRLPHPTRFFPTPRVFSFPLLDPPQIVLPSSPFFRDCSPPPGPKLSVYLFSHPLVFPSFPPPLRRVLFFHCPPCSFFFPATPYFFCTVKDWCSLAPSSFGTHFLPPLPCHFPPNPFSVFADQLFPAPGASTKPNPTPFSFFFPLAYTPPPPGPPLWYS